MDSSKIAQFVATTGLCVGVATLFINHYNRTRRPALMRLINAATERALLAGTLLPIDTNATQLDDGYKVLVATNLVKKHDGAVVAKNANPFLPPFEDGLFVSDLRRHHRLLLNKFPVSSPHVLVVTKDFVSQESPLSSEDFLAAHDVLDAFSSNDGLCFFNLGPLSGFSQPHKHIQIVAKPEDMLLELQIQNATVPFLHYLTYYERPDRLPDELARFLQAHMTDTSSYNLLWTKKWFMIIPRSAADCEGIGLNALGFTGTIFVKNAELADKVKAIGGAALLRHVGVPA